MKRVWILAVSALAGCASMFMRGGDLVSAGYNPTKVVATYDATGVVPPETQYLLVETEKGPAIFERSADGSGALFLTHWRDGQGDHYAGWVATGAAYEFVIPSDPKASGKRYVYSSGLYEVKTVDGVSRPVPAVKVEPVSTLVPKR